MTERISDWHLRLVAGDQLIKVAVQPASHVRIAAMQRQQLSQSINGCHLDCAVMVLRQPLQRGQHLLHHLSPQVSRSFSLGDTPMQ